MKRRLLLLLLLALPLAASAKTWTVVPAQSMLGFTGNYQGGPFKGVFKHFDAHITYDPAHLDQAKFDVSVDLSSVDTQSSERCCGRFKPTTSGATLDVNTTLNRKDFNLGTSSDWDEIAIPVAVRGHLTLKLGHATAIEATGPTILAPNPVDASDLCRSTTQQSDGSIHKGFFSVDTSGLSRRTDWPCATTTPSCSNQQASLESAWRTLAALARYAARRPRASRS